MLRNKNYHTTSIISLALILLFCMASCSSFSDRKVKKMMSADTTLFTQEGTNVTVNYTDSGNLKATIFAPQLIGYRKDGNEIIKMPKGVKGDFYNEQGEKESSLTAEKGISYQTQKITEVMQNVVVVNKKGERLNTEKLVWDQKKQMIYTDKFVKITTPTEILTGDGMQSSQDFTNWVIMKPRGRIAIQPDSTSKQQNGK